MAFASRCRTLHGQPKLDADEKKRHELNAKDRTCQVWERNPFCRFRSLTSEQHFTNLLFILAIKQIATERICFDKIVLNFFHHHLFTKTAT